MRIVDNRLDELIDKKTWYELQKHMAVVSNITTQIIDFYGNPVTDYSYMNPFCEYIQKNENLNGYCKKCKSRGAVEAVQRHKPYIHLCPFDLIEISVPIVIGNECLGSISGGQVALLVPEAGEHLEHLVEKRNMNEILKNDTIKKMYDQTPKMKCTDIMDATRMYNSVKDCILVSGQHGNQLESDHVRSSEKTVYQKDDNLKTEKEKNGNFFYEKCVPDEYLPKNHLLKPVFEYIFENKSENLSLTDAANLAHISASYFSRLFTKEVGVNYSLFMNQLKIGWSKELLMETDLSITQISNELGYNDSAYFVKIFKRYTGVTPCKFRRESQKKE